MRAAVSPTPSGQFDFAFVSDPMRPKLQLVHQPDTRS